MWHRGQAVAAGRGEEIEDLRAGAWATNLHAGLLRGRQCKRGGEAAKCQAVRFKPHVLQLRGHLLIDLPQLAVLPSQRDDQRRQQQGHNGEQDALDHRSSLNAALARTYRNWRTGC
ncbi:hypothetical protein G6F63_015321 [Rhizopus arrhizus]|nr:hypothetical protein G6F65_014915 [Rhizopus arrhizus]KAG1318207.1 hypothetical protein G6F63_015321 [Rhizopus arrhizus]